MKRISIGCPFNKYLYFKLFYPITPIQLYLTHSFIILIDIYLYYLVLFLIKNRKSTLNKSNIV